MTHLRAAILPVCLLAAGVCIPVAAQSVVSTRSGLIYFFEGSVYLGGEPLEQKFGRFPEIGAGRELRTEHGRAEILLTPGVFLRLAENSSIRMISDKLADTRVELLNGSAILESKEVRANTAVKLFYKNWHVETVKEGAYRIDSDPAQLRVYRGEVEVAANGELDSVPVHDGELLPFAAVLVTEKSSAPDTDPFKNWAIGRSQAISADNATAAGIIDDPNQFDQFDTANFGSGGFTYFPMTGIPSLGITNPYGQSFWSPYQSALTSTYFPPVYVGWPMALRPYAYPLRFSTLPNRIGTTVGTGIGTGLYTPGGIATPRLPIVSPVRPMAPVRHASRTGRCTRTSLA